jgi:PucR C-terminal helix-turn-helix domain
VLSGHLSPVPTARWELLLDAILVDRVGLTHRIHDEIRAQLPGYNAIADPDLARDISLEIDSAVAAARGGHERVSEGELAAVARVGRMRARQGVPIDEMFLAWRIGLQLILSHCRNVSGGFGIDASEMLELVQALLASSDRAMAIAANGHRGEELELARHDQETRTQLVKGILTGSMTPTEARGQARARGLDPGANYRAVRARPGPGVLRTEVERLLGFQEAVLPRRGLCAMIDGDLGGFLHTPASQDVPFAVGIGPPMPLESLGESFQRATRALSTARAFGLVGVNSVASLGVLPAIVSDADVGDALCRRYLDPLAGSTAEIAASLRVLFDCQMQIDSAAARLFVHPNTLRYRVARFQELTGGDVGDPATAFEVWWALQRARVREHLPDAEPDPDDSRRPAESDQAF